MTTKRAYFPASRVHRVALSGLLLAAMSPPAWSQQVESSGDSVESLRAEVDGLKQYIQALENRLQALEQAPAQTVDRPASLPPTAVAVQGAAVTVAPVAQAVEPAGTLPAWAGDVPPSPLPPRDSVADPQLAASRPDNAASPTDPELKGFVPIPGTETRFRIGGYAKLDAMYDPRDVGKADNFWTAGIPMDDAAGKDLHSFNLHAKQTRINFEARRPTPYGNLRFYLEGDFYGSSDGYQPRLRHAYGQLGNTYAGYGYSSFMDPDALPDTLDFAGAGSSLFVFVAGVHQSLPLGEGNTLTIAVEDPDAQVSDASGTHLDSAASGIPDLSAAFRIERDWGHLQLAGLYRRLGYAEGDRTHHENGGGISFTGSRTFGERDLLLFGGNWGQGIARYINDVGGLGLDAAIGPDGQLQALASTGGYFGYTHYWNPQWRSNLVYSQLRLEDSTWLAPDAFRRSEYTALNLIWSPASTWLMGMEVMYGRHEQQDGQEGEALRVQGSLQYNFIK